LGLTASGFLTHQLQSRQMFGLASLRMSFKRCLLFGAVIVIISICHSTYHSYNFFLDEMIAIHNKQTAAELESQGHMPHLLSKAFLRGHSSHSN
jgi:hypothetical protein